MSTTHRYSPAAELRAIADTTTITAVARVIHGCLDNRAAGGAAVLAARAAAWSRQTDSAPVARLADTIHRLAVDLDRIDHREGIV